MAQTQLNRIYVQAIDATGASVNSLSLGTKSLTSKVIIGGSGMSNNNITLETAGITLSGPTTIPTGLSTGVLNVTGNTTLTNASLVNVGVTGNSYLTNVSMNVLTVAGRSTLQNVSSTNLGVTGTTTLATTTTGGLTASSLSVTGNETVTGTLEVTGQTTLGITGTGALTAASIYVSGNETVTGTLGVTGQTTLGITGTGALTAASIFVSGNETVTGTLGVTGATTLGVTGTGALTVTGNETVSGTLGVTGATTLGVTGTGALTVTGNETVSGTLGVTGGTTLGVTGTGALTATSLTVTGNESVSGTLGVTGVTTLGVTGTGALTVTGNETVSGTLGVTGGTTLGVTGTGALTVTGNETVSGTLGVTGVTTLGVTGTGALTAASLTVTGQTTLQNASVTGTLAVTGNCTMNNVSVTALSVGNTLDVLGPATVTSISTKGYTSNLFNYAPTFTKTLVGGTLVITNGVCEFTLSTSSGSIISSVPVLFRANTKYIFNLTAFGDSGTSINLIDAAAGFTFPLTSTSTTYTKIITMPVTDTTSISLLINGTNGNKVTWTSLTIEPYYDMTLGSNTVSVAGDVNVTSGTPLTGWATNRMITSSTTVAIGDVASVAYGNGTWVMNGFLGTVLTSKNEGATWNSQVVGSTANFFRGCAYGLGIFVSTTSETPGKNYTSTDGMSWTLSTGTMPSGVAGINWVAFGNNTFVGVSASNTLFRSLNGSDWTSYTLTGQWYGVIYGNGIFVACGNGKIAKGSATGDSWAAIASPPAGEWRSIAYGNGIYMVSSWETGGGYIATSIDATTWTRVCTFGFSVTGLIYDDNAWFVSNYVSFNNGVTWTDTGAVGISYMASGNGKILGGYQNNQVFLMKRTARTDGTTITSDAMTIGGEGTSLNIISNNLNVTTGAPTVLFTYSSSATSISSRYGAYGNGIFVVIDEGSNRVLTTTTGLTAAFYTPPSTTTLRGLAYGLINGTGTFVLAAYASPSVWLSTNGTSWTGPTATTLNSVHTIAYGNGVFIAGCLTGSTNNNVGVSINGTTWTNIQTVPNTEGINKMAFGYMSTGVNVFLGLNTNFLCRSVNNGSSWTTISIPNRVWSYCEFGNDVFIAVDSAANSSISVSRDGGLTWSTPIQFGLKLSNPIYVDKTWCIGSTTGYTMISKDNALTWEYIYTIFSTNLFVYGNDKLLSFTASALTLVNAKTRRSDGTNITSDTITIGREAAIVNIGSDNLRVGTSTLGYAGIFIRRSNNAPSRYDVNILGFGCGGKAITDEPNDLRDITGINGTSCCARIKCVSNVDHPYDYGSIGTLSFQFKNGNLWTAGTEYGVYNTAMVIGGSSLNVTLRNNLVVNGSLSSGGGLNQTSDRRIKTNIVDVVDDQALQKVRLLKPKTYSYKDTETRGVDTVYGFIAQEVREVLNYSTMLSKNFIPNIYDTVTLSDDILTFSVFNTENLERDASGSICPCIKILTHKLADGILLNILEVLGPHEVKVDMTNYPKDKSENIIHFNQLFVYGQEVNDFHDLNKDAIWTVATAALQEVDRQLQAEKQKVADLQLSLAAETQKTLALETTLASVLARLDALERAS